MKKNILLLHGALGTESQFDRLLPLLNTSYQVFTMTFEGHGSQSGGGVFAIDAFAKNVRDYLDKKDLKRVTVFGYSMGGYVALRLASMGDKRVERILTLGTKFDWSMETAEKETSLLQPEKIQLKIPHFAAKLASDHPAIGWENVVRKTAEMMMGLANGLRMEESDLRRVTIPVHLGLGSQDHMVSLSETQNAQLLLSSADITILDGMKHAIEAANPEDIADFIRTFTN